jgi:hypothetical protein
MHTKYVFNNNKNNVRETSASIEVKIEQLVEMTKLFGLKSLDDFELNYVFYFKPVKRFENRRCMTE